MVQPLSVAYGRGLLVISHRSIGSLNARSSYATAITTAGEVLWTRFVANDAAAVVYDGAEFVIVYGDEPEIMAGVLDADGFVVEQITLARYREGFRPTAPRVVRTDSGLLAVWRETGPISGFGSELNDSFAVASNGPDALVVWINQTIGDPRRSWIAARQLDGAGTPFGTETGIPLTQRPGDPDVIWDGARYQAAWTSTSTDFQNVRLEVAAISPGAGEETSIAVINPSRAVFAPALAVIDDSVVLLAWSDYARGGVRGKLLPPNVTWEIAAERVVRTVPRDAVGPAAVWIGQHYATAWIRQDFWYGSEIVWRRFDRSGTPLDAEARVIARVGDAERLRATGSGLETAVVWTDAGRVFVSRVTLDGALIDPQPVLVATDATPETADVASNGNRFVITWADSDSVKARRLSDRGGFVDVVPIEVAAVAASTTRVAFDGSMFRVGYVSPSPAWGQDSSFPTASVSGQPPCRRQVPRPSLLCSPNPQRGASSLWLRMARYIFSSADAPMS